MKASDHFLAGVLEGRQQWVVPVYQRHYAWQTDIGRRQIQHLWEDVEAGAEEVLEKDGGQARPHFVGAIIYEPAKNQPYGQVPLHYVVDGQQRLSTFHLYLAALREVALTKDMKAQVSAIESYLFNPKSDAMKDAARDRHKLWPGMRDRGFYLALVEEGSEGLREKFPQYFKSNGYPYKNGVPKMIKAYYYFLNEIEHYFWAYENPVDYAEQYDCELDWSEKKPEQILDALLKGVLDAFSIVVVKLENNDDARGIFASLNGYSEPLTSFDLIRNDIFQRALASGENEEQLYSSVWSKLEGDFWDEEIKQGRSKAPRSEHFITHFLTAALVEDIRTRDIPHHYAEYVDLEKFANVEAEIKEIVSYADVYRSIEEYSRNSSTHDISVFLNTWDISVFHPVLLVVGRSNISENEKAKIFAQLKAYIIRRDLAGLTRKNYNNNALSIIRAFRDNEISLESFQNWIRSNDGDSSRMPSNEDIQHGVLNISHYDLPKPKLRYILTEIELATRTNKQEPIPITTGELHIEHVLPQQWSTHWALPDGMKLQGTTYAEHLLNNGTELSEDQRKVMERRERLKNTFGNLTILTQPLNQEISNHCWEVKSSDEGIGESLLAINKDIVNPMRWSNAWGVEGIEDVSTVWDSDIIEARGISLAGSMNKIWPIQS